MATVSDVHRADQADEAVSTVHVDFLPDRISVRVNVEDVPCSDLGLPGSVLDLAQAAGLHIAHACGGLGRCATCEVLVVEGLELCNPIDDQEREMLTEATFKTDESRLSCRCVPQPGSKLTVVIPH